MYPKDGLSLDLDPDPMDLMDLDLNLDPIHPSLTLSKILPKTEVKSLGYINTYRRY